MSSPLTFFTPDMARAAVAATEQLVQNLLSRFTSHLTGAGLARFDGQGYTTFIMTWENFRGSLGADDYILSTIAVKDRALVTADENRQWEVKMVEAGILKKAELPKPPEDKGILEDLNSTIKSAAVLVLAGGAVYWVIAHQSTAEKG